MHHDVRPKFNGAAPRTGVANVLSTISAASVPMGDGGRNFSISSTSMLGLAMVSPNSALVLGRKHGLNLVFGGFRRHESHFNAKPLERHGEQVQRAAVDGGGN